MEILHLVRISIQGFLIDMRLTHPLGVDESAINAQLFVREYDFIVW
ncbi:hypothetical protein Q670_04195 [Alcanivorax sp. P2S70]|nr:hypothetical protein Q670_04195 [Alcanivorax sp. P2S70]